MIPIFIPSYNRPQTHSTPALLNTAGIHNYKVVIRKSQWSQYRTTLPEKNLLVLPYEGELNAAREFTRTTLRNGQWCLHIDDDIRGFIMPQSRFYRDHEEIQPGKGETMITRATWQPTMNVEVNFKLLYDQCIADTMDQAVQRGAWLCGFGIHENPAFRPVKWRDVGYVSGGMMLMRNQGMPWTQTVGSSCEDYALTAAHTYENGRVLINKWACFLTVIYREGGCGTYEERLPSMMAAQQDLLKRYGALLGAKHANNSDKRQGELRIRFKKLEQVEQWRNEFEHPYDPNYRIYKGKLVMP